MEVLRLSSSISGIRSKKHVAVQVNLTWNYEITWKSTAYTWNQCIPWCFQDVSDITDAGEASEAEPRPRFGSKSWKRRPILSSAELFAGLQSWDQISDSCCAMFEFRTSYFIWKWWILVGQTMHSSGLCQPKATCANASCNACTQCHWTSIKKTPNRKTLWRCPIWRFETGSCSRDSAGTFTCWNFESLA